jgi:hypothetical protein
VASEADLSRVEKLYKKAVTISKAAAKARRDGSITTAAPSSSSSSSSRLAEDPLFQYEAELLLAERDAGKPAGEGLALLLCQSGRAADAAKTLLAMGMRYRLSEQVFCYKTRTGSDAGRDKVSCGKAAPTEMAIALDGALAPTLLDALRTSFGPDALFWKEHNYDPFLNCSRSVGYFSYVFDLNAGKTAPRNLPEQAVLAVYAQLQQHFPQQAAECGVAEWWVHSRPHSCGHQLHFDSDETFIEDGGAPTHPLVSCVVYLEEGDTPCGGPTLVTDQVLGGRLATEGWLCAPARGRTLLFDAKYLHGVVPGRGVGPACTPDVKTTAAGHGRRRLSFMVGFWRKLRARQRGPGNPGPGQDYPAKGSPRSSWRDDMGTVEIAGGISGAGACVDVPMSYVDCVWEKSSATAPSTGVPSYQACFQGF